MRELSAKVTTRGRVTIPIELRRLLGIEPHDELAFVVENGHVSVERARSAVDRTAGTFKRDLSRIEP